MALSFSLPRPALAPSQPASRLLRWVLALGFLAGVVAVVWAQVEGDRGIAPVASSSDIDVTGIEVDTSGDTAEEARENGWREAQRKAWEKLKGPKISDSQLEGLVSAIVIEQERIGPKRYIAKLGVIFDRARSSRYLGGESQGRRSAPMLVLPVTMSAGTSTMYEVRNPWQRAWAEFNPGTSQIDYVRPAGSGGESLLLTYGQTGRRSRTWWRAVLDQFAAADVIVPIADLNYQWPGGPVEGTFTARYGPDSTYLDGFKLTADNPAELPQMLAQAVQRFDGIFEKALADGKLRPDPTLSLGAGGTVDPGLQRLIEIGRAMQRREAAIAAGATENPETPAPTVTPDQPAVLSSYVVQFASPDAGTIDQTLAAVRSTAGVRGAVTSSLAIGGTSVMRVTYGGSLEQLASALRQRGFSVTQGSNALAISR